MFFYQRQLGPFSTTMPVSPPELTGVPTRIDPTDTGRSCKHSGASQDKGLDVAVQAGKSGPDPTKFQAHIAPSTQLFPVVSKRYVDSGMQTDEDLAEEALTIHTSDLVSARKPYLSLQKQLLTRCHAHKLRLDAVRDTLSQTPMQERNSENDSKSKSVPATPVLAPEPPREDVEMQDCQTVTSTPVDLPSNPPVEKPRPPDETANPGDEPMDSFNSPFKFPPSPWSSNNVQPYDRKQHINGYRSADLRVQLPSKQPFSTVSASTPVLVTTPTALSGPSAQSPLSHMPNTYPPLSTPTSGLIQPSPARKKISFGEYIRRGSQKHDTPATATAEKQQGGSSPIMTHNVTKPLALNNLPEEAKGHSGREKAVAETPKVEAGGSSEKHLGFLAEPAL